MSDLVLIAIVGAATFYLGHRALVTRWLWSHYPAWLDRLMGCSACLGFWVGLAIGAGYFHAHRAILGVEGWPAILTAGAAGMVLTPMVSAIVISALESLSGGDQG